MTSSAGQADLAGAARRSDKRTAYRLELADPDGTHQIRQGHATPTELAAILTELAAHYAARVTKSPPPFPTEEHHDRHR